MHRFLLRVSVWLFFAALIVGAPFTGARGQQTSSLNVTPAAGPNRPANVPDGYVVTPFGYFHASCVQGLAKGERMLTDGRIQRADGAIKAKVAACNSPHYLRSGVAANASATGATPEIDGWVEDANATTGSVTQSYGALIATWTVPSQPTADDGQVLYFFPGLEDINGVQSILQPVLGWYRGQWTLASWNCCLDGIVTHSPAVAVAPGDQVYGSMTNSCTPGALSCAAWNVLSVDLSTGESTTLEGTPSNGQTFNWAFGGVLEAYYVNRCEDYPPDHRLAFEQVILFDQNLKPVPKVKWTDSVGSATPQCHYNLAATYHKVTVWY